MKIISGGQTGVDRAALDVAIELGIPCGGWCPKGRRSEDGTIPLKYPLQETPTPRYEQRTEWNVRDSQATLVLTVGHPTRGTALAVEFAQQHGKPYLVVDLSQAGGVEMAKQWIAKHQLEVLNVASELPAGLYAGGL